MKKGKPSIYDVVIVGSGPSGLAAGIALQKLGLRCVIVEAQSEAAVSMPADDGREIALSHRSAAFLKRLGAWGEIAAGPIGRIDVARVRNESMGKGLCFSHTGTAKDRLSYMVPNNLIRKALYDVAVSEGVQCRYGSAVADLELGDLQAYVQLKDGTQLWGRLLVAADSRFSALRNMAGIEVEMKDFHRSMIVTKMRHKLPHRNTAYEWFQRTRTLAMLPLRGHYSSAVLTVDSEIVPDMMALDSTDYALKISQWFNGRLGEMQEAGKRFVYPLVATYAAAFHAPSFVLVGDAAVGMHPVTAHGFNFGLRGVETLSSLIARAMKNGSDFGGEAVLAAYTHAHRSATRPLYLATNYLATLYSRKDFISRMLRRGFIRAGHSLPGIQHAISRLLTDVAA